MPDRTNLVKRLGASAALGALLCAGAAGQAPQDGQSITVTGCRITYIDAVSLSSERGGVLAEIAAPGLALAAGQDVARLRDTVLRAGLAIAEREASNDVDVRFAAKAAELAELKYERALQANRSVVGTVSDLELRELRLAADRAALECEQAEHRFAVAALRLEEIRATVETLHVAAPFAGRVRATYKRPGEVVQEGEIISEIVNTDRLRVEGDVDLHDLAWVFAGAEVYVQLDGALVPPELARGVFPGVITFVDVKVEPVSKKVHIAAEVDNRDGLLREGLPAVMLIRRTQNAEGQALTATPTR